MDAVLHGHELVAVSAGADHGNGGPPADEAEKLCKNAKSTCAGNEAWTEDGDAKFPAVDGLQQEAFSCELATAIVSEGSLGMGRWDRALAGPAIRHVGGKKDELGGPCSSHGGERGADTEHVDCVKPGLALEKGDGAVKLAGRELVDGVVRGEAKRGERASVGGVASEEVDTGGEVFREGAQVEDEWSLPAFDECLTKGGSCEA